MTVTISSNSRLSKTKNYSGRIDLSAFTECKCQTCGKEFMIHSCYIARDGIRKYCTMVCRDFKGDKNPRYKADEGWTICKKCSKRFKQKPSLIKSGRGKKYCTDACRIESTGKVSKTCVECKTEFMVHIAQYEKRTHCSRRCASVATYRIKNQMNKGVQRGNGGKRPDLENRYFRSSWEANYARYLNYLVQKKKILRWEYEPDTFEFHAIKKGTRFYTPDFKVYQSPESFEFHEVKGWMDAKSKTRQKRMSKYYPQIKVIIIDKSWFRRNGSLLSGIIQNWEKNNPKGHRLY